MRPEHALITSMGAGALPPAQVVGWFIAAGARRQLATVVRGRPPLVSISEGARACVGMRRLPERCEKPADDPRVLALGWPGGCPSKKPSMPHDGRRWPPAGRGLQSVRPTGRARSEAAARPQHQGAWRGSGLWRHRAGWHTLLWHPAAKPATSRHGGKHNNAAPATPLGGFPRGWDALKRTVMFLARGSETLLDVGIVDERRAEHRKSLLVRQQNSRRALAHPIAAMVCEHLHYVQNILQAFGFSRPVCEPGLTSTASSLAHYPTGGSRRAADWVMYRQGVRNTCQQHILCRPHGPNAQHRTAHGAARHGNWQSAPRAGATHLRPPASAAKTHAPPRTNSGHWASWAASPCCSSGDVAIAPRGVSYGTRLAKVTDP